MGDVIPPSGRGERLLLAHPGGIITVLDESYNANPASVRAALAVLAQMPLGPGGRRVAILGDMLELGEHAPDLHAALADAVAQNGIDLVYAAGPLMQHLFEALPAERRGCWRPNAETLAHAVLADLRPGDAVTVKGSNGAKTAAIVAALKTRYPLAGPDAA
jgi:UDP-N-acetylmuramoyl-tripeptide--D-alanyl-D-alanine ligase